MFHNSCIHKVSLDKNTTWSRQKLEQRHYILFKTIIENTLQNTSKRHPKVTPKWPQMAPFWGLGATLEPARFQNSNFDQVCPLKVSKRDPFGTLWGPWDPTNPQNLPKNTLKILEWKRNTKKSRIGTLPKLKNYGFTIVKHTFSKIPLTTKKSLKWPPNDPQMTPKWTQGC